MNIQIERHYCKGDDGRHLFILDLIKIEDFPFLLFNCSLPIDFRKYPGIQNQIEKITWLGTDEEERYDCVYIFFWLVKRIKDIEKYFFSVSEVDSEGNPIYSSLKADRNEEYSDIKEFLPISGNCNSSLFQMLKEKFVNYKKYDDTIEVEKECIEELISCSIELQEAYVDVYNMIMERHVFSVVTKNDSYEFYILSSDTEVLLMFYKKGSK